MSDQLISPPECAPPSVKHLPLEKRVQLWMELLDANHALLLAGLRARIGADGDLRAAYNEWNTRRQAERDRWQIEFAQNMTRREARDGR